mgnify:CR=1 FL=1
MTAIIIELICLITLMIGAICSCFLMHKKLDILVRLAGSDLYSTLKLRGLSTQQAVELVEEALEGPKEEEENE